MNKFITFALIILLWASAVPAQQATGAKDEVLEGYVGPTYNWVSDKGNLRAAEYEYPQSGVGADVHVEYDPLPNRFSVETHYLNKKDYFGEMDYAYRDVVLFNFLTRGVFHNLDHLSFGTDDPSTTSPRFTDRNPGAEYSIENALQKGFIRFKAPDYPFHVYANVLTIERSGTIQQRFMRGYSGSLDKVSESRDIDWKSQEATLGVNSHLGPIEVDYSHTAKNFTSHGDRVMYDTYASPDLSVPHNLVPDLTSSTDTIKVHSSFTGRIVATATYADGSKKNDDSAAKSDFKNTAGDLVLTPLPGMVMALKYRHYDISNSNPDTVTVSSLAGLYSTYTFTVRDSLSQKRDVVTGILRYRFTDRLTAKGEYVLETVKRDLGSTPGEWDVAPKTTKVTGKLGLAYRMTNKLTLRADASSQKIENPAYADDPDEVLNAKTTVTWMPVQRLIAVASYSGIQEKRNDLTAPLAGGTRKTSRDQALGSLTLLVGKRSSLTASYMYYKNKTKETFTFTDESGLFALEGAVPYSDKAQVVTLAASHALTDRITLTADGSRCLSEGSFRVDGSVAGTTGIDSLSDLKVVEDIYTASVAMQLGANAGAELRYQYRQYNDKIDDTQDGRVNTALTTLYVKW